MGCSLRFVAVLQVAAYSFHWRATHDVILSIRFSRGACRATKDSYVVRSSHCDRLALSSQPILDLTLPAQGLAIMDPPHVCLRGK